VLDAQTSVSATLTRQHVPDATRAPSGVLVFAIDEAFSLGR
jgi:hypothetical protein